MQHRCITASTVIPEKRPLPFPDIAACKVIIRTYLIVLYMGPYAPHAL